jgi:hypothetical protein
MYQEIGDKLHGFCTTLHACSRDVPRFRAEQPKTAIQKTLGYPWKAGAAGAI